MYRVIEVANQLGVSKVTIYKKISLFKKELKPHIHKKRNITFIDDQGVEIIKESLIANHVIADSTDKDNQIDELNQELELHQSQVKLLNDRLIETEKAHMEDLQLLVSTLEAQVNLKKTQIESKNRLMRNFKDLVAYNKSQIKRIEEKIQVMDEA